MVLESIGWIVFSTLGMAVSIIVNIVILSIGVFAGSTILLRLPRNVVDSFNYLLPSLFGAIFVQFALMKLKLAPIALGIDLNKRTEEKGRKN